MERRQYPYFRTTAAHFSRWLKCLKNVILIREEKKQYLRDMCVSQLLAGP